MNVTLRRVLASTVRHVIASMCDSKTDSTYFTFLVSITTRFIVTGVYIKAIG